MGRRLQKVSEGRLRRPAHVVHTALTVSQLALLSRLDRRGRELPSAEEQAELAARVTMVVKTFERPKVVRRLIDSARPVFSGRIVVADDSREPVTDLGPGVDVLPLPFNVGLSAGRNAAVDTVQTEYLFLTDDDIVFTAATDLVAMMEYLDQHPDVDIIAPQLVYLPWWYAIQTEQHLLFPGADPPLRVAGEDIGGATVAYKVQNVFLARTEAIREIRWEDRLRLVEHRDFFSRASGKLVCVQADGVRAYHARTPFDDFYMGYRNDIGPSAALLGELWSRRTDRHQPARPSPVGDETDAD